MILLHQNTADASSLCFHSITSCNKSQDMIQSKRKGGRVVDGTGLENRQVNSFAGSNPVPSARKVFGRPEGSCRKLSFEKADRMSNAVRLPVPCPFRQKDNKIYGTVAQLVRAWDS